MGCGLPSLTHLREHQQRATPLADASGTHNTPVLACFEERGVGQFREPGRWCAERGAEIREICHTREAVKGDEGRGGSVAAWRGGQNLRNKTYLNATLPRWSSRATPWCPLGVRHAVRVRKGACNDKPEAESENYGSRALLGLLTHRLIFPFLL